VKTSTPFTHDSLAMRLGDGRKVCEKLRADIQKTIASSCIYVGTLRKQGRSSYGYGLTGFLVQVTSRGEFCAFNSTGVGNTCRCSMAR
jgi:hypothetical protein